MEIKWTPVTSTIITTHQVSPGLL